MKTTLNINKALHQVDVDPDTPLLWVIRDVLGMTGTKFGCGMALCGACTVHLDGQAVRSCVTPLTSVANREVTTIEGLQSKQAKAVQTAWVELQVPQCGYCQSGQIMQAAALFARTKKPTREEIIRHMDGNLCRCGTYLRIISAIERAAREAEP